MWCWCGPAQFTSTHHANECDKMQIVCAIRPSVAAKGPIGCHTVHCPGARKPGKTSFRIEPFRMTDRPESTNRYRPRAIHRPGPLGVIQTAAIPLLFNDGDEGKPVSSYSSADPFCYLWPRLGFNWFSLRPVQLPVWPKCKFTFIPSSSVVPGQPTETQSTNHWVTVTRRRSLSFCWENWFWQLSWESLQWTHTTHMWP